MRKTICILMAFCLALIGLGSCSLLFDDDTTVTVQASMVCHYPGGAHADQIVEGEFEYPYNYTRKQELKDEMVGTVIDELRGDVPEGFSEAELKLKYYTQYGMYKTTEYYSIWWSTAERTYFFEKTDKL
ncbi:MAG: hypothetical protein MJY67_03440 [Bacteroidales bacterium]|nr:hypothetical protein [Bacteroidales bacterium]